MIKLSIPHLAGKEKEYVDEAVQSTWIVPLGPWVDRFESNLTGFACPPTGTKNIVALSSGTAAIHLGLVMAGVKPGDEVICQSLTFSASCNPIVYCGASPVLIDSEPTTWNLSPQRLEEAIVDRKKQTGRFPAAIVAVDLYGMPCLWSEILEIAGRYEIPIVEDAAEALGSTYRGDYCGTFGLYGAFSFNGNKLITTSGGGALVCPDSETAKRAKFLSTQAREDRPYYYHTTLGFNYRLSNVSAAIGCAQFEEIEQRLGVRRRNHAIYAAELNGFHGIRVHDNPTPEFNSNFWLTTILLADDCKLSPDQLRLKLLEQDIETRLIWRPMHLQPFYADCPYYGDLTSEGIFKQGLCLPSGSALSEDEVGKVISAIRQNM